MTCDVVITQEQEQGGKPDYYGQVHPVETEELIRRKRVEFEEQVLQLPDEALVNLKQAQIKCPEQLTDEFKLQFLRCEVFDAARAAKRYARYWDKRVEICGPERAFLPMTLDGVLRGDEHTLKTGCFQVLTGCKDPKGRGVIMFTPSVLRDGQYHGAVRITRVLWYMVHACLERTEAQRYGMVCLFCPGPMKLSHMQDRGLEKMLIGSCQGALPIRISACHVCPAPSFTKIIWPVIRLVMSKRTRNRVRFHYAGSDKEQLASSLEKYGLELSSVPIQIGGEYDHDHDAWLAKRRREGK